jgi:hypothetical protein
MDKTVIFRMVLVFGVVQISAINMGLGMGDCDNRGGGMRQLYQKKITCNTRNPFFG